MKILSGDQAKEEGSEPLRATEPSADAMEEVIAGDRGIPSDQPCAIAPVPREQRVGHHADVGLGPGAPHLVLRENAHAARPGTACCPGGGEEPRPGRDGAAASAAHHLSTRPERATAVARIVRIRDGTRRHHPRAHPRSAPGIAGVGCDGRRHTGRCGAFGRADPEVPGRARIRAASCGTCVRAVVEGRAAGHVACTGHAGCDVLSGR